MKLSVTVLGCSAMYATRERASSGYLLEYADKRIWMDAGGGTWRNLLQHIEYPAIDGILLSHRHPDHTIDIFQAFHARMYGQAERLAPIPVWAPQETIDRLVGFYSEEMHSSFDLNSVADGQTVDVEGASISFVRMAHPPETLGMRIEYDDVVLAYSADSGPAADFGRLAGRADLFLCEATFQEADEEWDGHMTAMQAGTVASEAEVAKVVLTHLPDNRDLGLTIAEAHKTSGDVEVQLAADGLRIEL